MKNWKKQCVSDARCVEKGKPTTSGVAEATPEFLEQAGGQPDA